MLIPIKSFDGPRQLYARYFTHADSIGLSPTTKFLSSVAGDLDLIRTENEENRSVSFPLVRNVSSYAWRKDAPDAPIVDIVAIVTSGHDLIVNGMNIDGSPFKRFCTWNLHIIERTVVSVMEKITSVKALGYWINSVCLFLNQQFLCSFQFNEELILSGWIEVPPVVLPPIFHRGLVAFLTSQNVLYLYHLEKKEKIAEWELKELEINGQVENLLLNDTLDKLILRTCNNQIIVLKTNYQPKQDEEQNVKDTNELGDFFSFYLPFRLEGYIFHGWLLHDSRICFNFISKAHSSKSLVIDINIDGKDAQDERADSIFWLVGSAQGLPLLLSPTRMILLFPGTLSYIPKMNSPFYDCAPLTMARLLLKWENFSESKEILTHGLTKKDIYIPFLYFSTFTKRVQALCRKDDENRDSELAKERSHFISIISEIYYHFQLNVTSSTHDYSLKLIMLVKSSLEELIIALDTSPRSSQVIEDFKDLLCLHAVQTRNLIHTSTEDFSDDEKETILEDPLDNHLNKEIVDMAIISGEMLPKSEYLLTKRKLTPKEVRDLFQKRSHALIVDLIVGGHISSAKHLITKLGLSEQEVFLTLFKTSTDPKLQQHLYSEVKDILSPEQLKSMVNLRTLQKIYPCTSIQKALPSYTRDKSLHQLPYPPSFEEASNKPPQWRIGDLGPLMPSASSSDKELEVIAGHYCYPVFDWCKDWNETTWERVFFEAYISKASKNYIPCSAITCWQYLLEHGHLHHIKEWISAQLQNGQSSSPFMQHPIDSSIVDATTGPLFLKEIVLNILARHGIFCMEDLENFAKLLQRLGLSMRFSLQENGCPVHEDYVTQADFAHRFVHFCLQHELINVLHFFLTKSHSSCTLPSCPHCSTPIVQFIQTLKMTSQNDSDNNFPFHALMATSKYIYDLPEASLKALRNSAPPEVFLATALTSSLDLKTLFTPDELRETLLPQFPIIVSLLDPSFTPDISIYQLLQGNKLFDVTRLFGWQKTNTIRCEEALQELPHFTSPQLVQTHSSQESVNYVYYLLQGRPSLALYSSLGEGLRKPALMAQIQSLALRHHDNPRVTSACIALLEMWGMDSYSLAVHLNVANLLHHSSNLSNSSTSDIASLLEDDSSSGQAILLSELENAIEKLQQKMSRSEANTIFLWTPVISYFHLHNLRPPSKILEESAKAGDWLGFFIYAQIFQISVDQVMSIARKFPNPAMADNIYRSLAKVKSYLDSYSDGSPSVPRRLIRQPSINLRHSMYSKLGLQARMSIATSPTKIFGERKFSIEEQDPYYVSEFGETEFSASISCASSGQQQDLVGQILSSACIGGQSGVVNSTQFLDDSLNLQNPILALVAGHFASLSGGGDSQITPLARWLGDFLGAYYPTYQLEVEGIENMLESCFESSTPQGLLLLHKGFRLFFSSDCPLLLLSEFFLKFFVEKRYEDAEECLSLFINTLNEYTPPEDSLFLDKKWVAETSLNLVKHFLIMKKPFLEQDTLLHQLAYSELEETFINLSVKPPSFNKLYQLLHPLENISIPLEYLLNPEESTEYSEGFWSIINSLQQKGRFREALGLANSLKLETSRVILQELHWSSKSKQQESVANLIIFWKHCHLKLENYRISPEKAFSFFLEQGESCKDDQERFIIYKQAQKWLSGLTSLGHDEVSQFHLELWHSLLRAVLEKESCLEEMESFLLESKSTCLKNPQSFTCKPRKYLQKELETLNTLIDWFLSHGLLYEASQISQVFNFATDDFTLVKLCLALVHGEVNPTADLGQSDSQSSIVFTTLKDLDYLERQLIFDLEDYAKKAPKLEKLVESIKIIYLTSLTLRRPFDDLVESIDFLKLIKLVFITNAEHRFFLIKGLASVSGLPPEELTNFIIDEVLQTLKYWSHDKGKLDQFFTEDFKEILLFGGNTSIIANNLMTHADDLMNENQNSKQNISIAAELYICAHSSFTHLCSLDGIAQVLDRVRNLCTLACQNGLFSLVVRLLTAVGRYTEMSYVFSMLHTHNQLELLFKKGMEKEEKLKLALLDFINHRPDLEKELKPMLTLSFTMFRESATMTEDNALCTLESLSPKLLEQSNVKKLLNQLMMDFANAADNYCMAKCFQHATRCTSKAQLLALQIYFATSKEWILNLKEEQVSSFIINHNCFEEALLVAEEYQHHTSWAAALFHQVVELNNVQYLQSFKEHNELSPQIATEVANRFKVAPNMGNRNISSFKQLVKSFPCLKTQVKIFVECGWESSIHTLSQDAGGAYVKELARKMNIR